MNTNTTAHKGESLLDENKHRPTRVADSLTLTLYRLTTGVSVSSLPCSLCSEFVSRSQQLVHPGFPGRGKLQCWLLSSPGRCSDAFSGEALLHKQTALRRSISHKPGTAAEGIHCRSKDASHAVQAHKVLYLFKQTKKSPNWS